MKTTLTLAALGLTASIASATLVAQKTYDAGDFGFADKGMSNQFDNADGKIDGANSLGLFGTGSYVDYSTVNTYNTAGQVLKFEEGDNGLQINDGKDDFGTGGVVFAENAVYDISVTTEIGSNKYSYTAKGPDGVGGEAVASGTDFTLSSGTVNSFGQVSFYMNGPGGAGNDGFVDSITVDVTPVPEPSSTALLALGGIAMAFRRRK